ncbi:MAG: hypothetical protein RIK87_19170 [Fuerstiella sp.]
MKKSLGRKLEPVSRRVLNADEFAEVQQQRQQQMESAGNVGPSVLVHRNYWWILVDGPGLIEEQHHFDDGSGAELDFLTVSLMGWNVFFEDEGGKPAPFPQHRVHCQVGEIPMSHDWWFAAGWLDPAWIDGAPGKPWWALIQVGFFGWKKLASLT